MVSTFCSLSSSQSLLFMSPLQSSSSQSASLRSNVVSLSSFTYHCKMVCFNVVITCSTDQLTFPPSSQNLTVRKQMISKIEAREAPVTRVMMPPATPNTLNKRNELITGVLQLPQSKRAIDECSGDWWWGPPRPPTLPSLTHTQGRSPVRRH